MFNINKPMLVFSGPCHLPFTGQFYGWGFDLYEYHMDKPRGLFFSHISEAVMFARRYEASFCMDPNAAPDRVSVLEYVLTRHDESNWPTPPHDGRSTNKKTPLQLAQLAAAREGRDFNEAEVRAMLDCQPVADDELYEMDTEMEGTYGADWVGSHTDYTGGRARSHLDGDVDASGLGALDWFGGED